MATDSVTRLSSEAYTTAGAGQLVRSVWPRSVVCWRPASDRGPSVQPVKRSSSFHSLAPCRSSISPPCRGVTMDVTLGRAVLGRGRFPEPGPALRRGRLLRHHRLSQRTLGQRALSLYVLNRYTLSPHRVGLGLVGQHLVG